MSFIQSVIDYLNHPLPSHPHRINRHRFYAAVLTFLAFFYIGIFLLSKPTIAEQEVVLCLICMSVFLLTHGGTWYLLEEWFVPSIFKKWGAFSERTIGKEWFIFCIALTGGYTLAQLVKGPTFTLILPEQPLSESNHLKDLLSSIFYGSIVVFLINHVRLKMWLDSELQKFRKIQHYFDEKQKDDDILADKNPKDDFPQISLSTPESKEIVETKWISYIKVEEHYSRFFIKNAEAPREILTRMSLKEAIAILPDLFFVQIHRSYVVNLGHVSKLNKKDGISQLVLDEETILPVSRQRTSEVLQKLENYLTVKGIKG